MHNIEAVTDNATVLLHIDIKLKDGSVADSTRVNREPAMIRLGAGDVTEKFESYLKGMKVGEKKQFTLEAKDAYGYSNPANLHTLPRNRFDDSIALEKGLIMEFEQLTGEKMLGVIRDFTDTEVVIDFNHPLCGQTLDLTIEILKIV